VTAGDIVISDRYSDSTVAYQGYGRGFDLKLLADLNRLASDGMKPDMTIVLDVDVETGLERTRARVKGATRVPDRFEGQDYEFHRRVRQGFLAIARSEPDRVIVIDAARPVDAVGADMRNAVGALVARRCL
jgi:dTMP kinase